MRSYFEEPARNFVFMALLLEWLTQVMKSDENGSLSGYIMARAQASLSINLQGVRIVSLGPGVLVVGGESVLPLA